MNTQSSTSGSGDDSAQLYFNEPHVFLPWWEHAKQEPAETLAGLLNIRDAGLNAQATLAIPYSEATEGKYHRAKEVVEEANHR